MPPPPSRRLGQDGIPCVFVVNLQDFGKAANVFIVSNFVLFRRVAQGAWWILNNNKKTSKNENETDDQVDLRQLNFHHEKID